MDLLSTIAFTIFCFFSAIIVLTALFSPIPRKIGFRNIYRRFGNTILVVIGSLVGSALISGSLVLSDSLDKTFLDSVERNVGEQDMEIRFEELEVGRELIPYITEDEYKDIRSYVEIDEVDGILPSLVLAVTPAKLDENNEAVINSYSVKIIGLDIEDVRNFGENPIDIIDIEKDEVLVSKPLADELELSINDKIAIPYGPVSITCTVKKIYEENGIFGSKNMIVSNSFLTEELAMPENSYNTILISANGGIEPDNYNGEDFENLIEDKISDYSSERIELSTLEYKQDALDGYGLKMFVIMFVVLSFFGILSGILLIVNLYAMLAEERKMEMGILRAIALTRFQLTKTFIYEGFIYSLISSALGSLSGLGIGFVLVKTLASMITKMSSLTSESDFFQLSFGFKFESLAISFCIGFIITIITTIIASFKISKLNIVSAIRDIKEKKAFQTSCKWVTQTLLSIVMFLGSIATLVSFFTIRSTLTDIRNTGDENNPLTSMTEKSFQDNLDLIQGYLLYFGFVLTVFTGIIVVNRIGRWILKKDINKLTTTIASVVNILFTAFMYRLDSTSSAASQNGGVLLFFASGVILVISFALIITYNLPLISKIIIWPLKKIDNLQSILRLALRYPNENRTRTGLTLVMFALVIFLISYISMVKATMNVEMKEGLENTLGGFDLIIFPAADNDSKQVSEMEEKIRSIESVSEVSVMREVSIILPEIKYKDLPEADYHGDPSQIPDHNEDDPFQTYFNALPEDFISNTQIALKERVANYETDEDVWNAVINDSSKVVLGDAFVQIGFGQQPELNIGDKILISDLYEDKVYEKEVIGLVDAQENMGVEGSLYPYILTSSNHIEKELDQNYLDKYSSINILTKFDDNANEEELGNKIRKKLINYNISFIMNLDDLTGTALYMVNTLMNMFQGFLAFSLIVGTSGLAIIITRAVHERRQQIGMLRSLGFQRLMILASFFIESTFITFLGIVIGLSMGTIAALSAFEVEFRDNPDASPIFPVQEIFLICLAVYIASILFSILPSIKAARLSPVEATNYPE